jgi:hypothetical protein
MEISLGIAMEEKTDEFRTKSFRKLYYGSQLHL